MTHLTARRLSSIFRRCCGSIESSRRLTLLLTLAACVLAAAAPLTPGNSVLYRTDTGTGSLVNTGNPVFLDEYTPAGVLVQSIPLPTAASPGVNQLIASGTSTSEGLITRSADGKFAILTGYAANIPVTTTSRN